jgi:prepilin-type N-terminal cleavage/methylation domain-containing protein/prepilin-type processing-associated H-X9-DG protein
MAVGRKRGFTLIELLVVIAIIGILAAMLFPVFARARESARKTQCLANVKNIAMAVQLYLTDYDRTPPGEYDQEAVAYLNSIAPADKLINGVCRYKDDINPYLRWPVVFDEYIKSRAVWSCPSARLPNAPNVINPGYGPGGWLGYLQANASQWQSTSGGARAWAPGCVPSWPPGWGGSVTDSFVQQLSGASAPDAFRWSIWTNTKYGLLTSAVNDPTWYVIVADGPIANLFDPATLAYPDLCALGCAGPQCWEPVNTDSGCSTPYAVQCGGTWQERADPSLRKTHSRHMGGTNIGFMDGHAKWMASESILAESPRYAYGGKSGGLVYRKLEGLDSVLFPTSAGGAPGVAEGTNPDPSCPKGGLLY